MSGKVDDNGRKFLGESGSDVARVVEGNYEYVSEIKI
jgi:hypothetical protein